MFYYIPPGSLLSYTYLQNHYHITPMNFFLLNCGKFFHLADIFNAVVFVVVFVIIFFKLLVN